jgi:RNase P/RNase MRP subunit p30
MIFNDVVGADLHFNLDRSNIEEFARHKVHLHRVLPGGLRGTGRARTKQKSPQMSLAETRA